MPTTLHIIVSCTDKKLAAVPEELRLRSVAGSSIEERLSQWLDALGRAQVKRKKASDLYGGDHWAVARDLPEAAKQVGFDASLWVASAGYGLVPATAELAPYSATFARNSPDTMLLAGGEPTAQMRAWWKGLSAHGGRLRGGGPRSVEEVARKDSEATILVVASPAYISAMNDDLLDARKRLADPQRLLLITGTPGPREELADCWIPSKARYRQRLGGALMSLHARLARYLLSSLEPQRLTAREARDAADSLASECPPLTLYTRKPAVDDAVREYIRQGLQTNPKATHTRLLREYRQMGQACEQGRFRALFMSVRGER